MCRFVLISLFLFFRLALPRSDEVVDIIVQLIVPWRPHASGVRTIMSIATEQDWDAVACDLTQGFIQADLPKGEKTIYISPPPGVEENSDVVYEVMRPLYGMPHSGRCLHVTWSNWLKEQGFYKVG